MIKIYRYKLLPTKQQTILLEKLIGSNRFIWNHFLEKRKQEYKENKARLNYYEMCKQLTLLKKELGWLTEVNAQSLQQCLKDLDKAYNRFFKRLSDFPRFKSKDVSHGFLIPQAAAAINGRLYIPR